MVNILKLCLIKILTLDLVEMLMFGSDFEIDALLSFCDMNSTLGSVVPLAMFFLFVVVLVDPYDYVFPVPAILWRRSPRPNLA